MASKTITGIALAGSEASWTVIDQATGNKLDDSVERCAFDAPVSGLLAEGGDGVLEAGSKLKEALSGVKGDVVVSMPSDQVLLRIMDLPTSDPQEIASMVGLQIDKVSPFPIDRMIVAHEVIAKKENGVAVAGLAIRRDLIHNASELLKAADIVPMRVDVNSLVWWRLIKGSGSVSDEGRQVFIVFNGQTAEFVIVSDGVPLLFRAFARQEDQSDKDFMDEICDELGYTLMSMELEHGAFSDFSTCVWSSNEISEDVLARPTEMSGGNLELSSLADLPGLAEGAAIRCSEEGAIDLTPNELLEERQKRAIRKKISVSLAGVGLVWLVSLAFLFGGVAFQKYRLSRVEKAIKSISSEAIQVRELRRKVRTISLYTDRSRSALECIREVSLKQPSGIDLNMLNYRKGVSLRVGGDATRVEHVYEFKKNMDASALWESVTLDGPKRNRGKEVFEIEAALPGGGE